MFFSLTAELSDLKSPSSVVAPLLSDKFPVSNYSKTVGQLFFKILYGIEFGFTVLLFLFRFYLSNLRC
jgi:hypothetical protein